MSRTPGRLLGAAVTVALVLAPILATAATAATAATGGQAPVGGAAGQSSRRHTVAMELADMVGEIVGLAAESDGLDGRSTRSVREVLALLEPSGTDPLRITVRGLSDANHDGLDDDARLSVRVLDNAATLTLHRDRTHAVADAGFIFGNRFSVLKESAQSYDRTLRVAAALGIDDWNMHLIKELKAEMPTGVRVVSDYDGNHDGYDDDGRLTFLANGKAVTLTIGNTVRQVGKVSYGPTWQTKAPRRTHRPVGKPYLGSASLASRHSALVGRRH